jgi:FtsP/CotA-like multicopper oxidase with cupredoxin domain
MIRLTRRHFLSASTAAAGTAWAGLRPRDAMASPTRLDVVHRSLEVNGRPATVFGIVQPEGTPGLATAAGQRFHVVLRNQIAEPTLVHWHGLTPPSDQDGVPVLSAPEVPPLGIAMYDFPLTQGGTHWMHSHVGLQEQNLLAAPLIVRDPAEAHLDEQEVVILLHDFTFRDPEEIFAELRAGGAHVAMPIPDPGAAPVGAMAHGAPHPPAPMDHARMGPSSAIMPTAPSGAADHAAMGHGATARWQTEAVLRDPLDLNDVEFDAFLANDRTLRDPEVVRVERGGRVRLRVINAASATNFFLDLGALEGEVIAADGVPTLPIRGTRFELAIAQRLDVRIVLPAAGGAWPILALREGDTARAGIVLASPGARVALISERAEHPAGVVALDLERRLDPAMAVPQKPADRAHAIDLTGSMAEYVWTVNGRAFGEDQPLPVRYGERVEITMRNRTVMSHPMYLHGHHFQIVAINDRRFEGAIRDTVLVPPNQSVTIAFDADNPGHWAFHCHHLYHMVAGMMTSLRYEA